VGIKAGDVFTIRMASKDIRRLDTRLCEQGVQVFYLTLRRQVTNPFFAPSIASAVVDTHPRALCGITLNKPVICGRDTCNRMKASSGRRNFLRHQFPIESEFAILDRDHGHTFARDVRIRAECDQAGDSGKVAGGLQGLLDGLRIC
jgi:hypothetical protein